MISINNGGSMIFLFNWNEYAYLAQTQVTIPGDSMRPVDPIVSDRIRVGFYQNPTFSIKSRSDPIAII